MRKFLVLLLFSCAFCSTALAQQKVKVSGQVVNELGSPFAGVLVQEGKTTNAAITDNKGEFNLEVDNSGSLSFTFLGYAPKTFNIGTRTIFNVAMESTSNVMDELIVVGYGVQKKETLTGAVAQISASSIQTTKSTNLISNIQGKIPGVMIRQNSGEPGAYNSMIDIRGYGSAPLVVIDGVVRSDMGKLNAEDIESISVLKDASAAIYGINASSGAVIITTRKARETPTKVTYSGMYGIQQPTGMRKSVDAFTYRALRNEMGMNWDGNPIYTNNELIKWHDGTEPGYQDYNWMDKMLKNHSDQQSHTITVSGGGKKASYYISGGYTSESGLLASNIQQYDKYNFRANMSADLFKNLKADVSVTGIFDKNRAPSVGYIWIFKPIITADRGYAPHTLDNPYHLTKLPGEGQNPYAMMNESIAGYAKSKNSVYQTTLNLTYNFPYLDGLQFKALGAVDSYTSNGSNLRRGYQEYNYKTDAKVGIPAIDKYTNSYNVRSMQDLQAQAIYANTFAEDHTVGGTLVWQATRSDADILTGTRQWDDIFTHDILNQGSKTNLDNGGYRVRSRMLSFLGRFNYDYKGKYMAEFIFRNDGSYRYAKGDRWAFNPSGSIGWRISEEPFIKNALPFLTNLKVRGSYGSIAYDMNAEFQWYKGYTLGGAGYAFNYGNVTSGLISPALTNPNLTWSKAIMTNIGVDIGMWNNKFNMSIDIFEKKVTGIPASSEQSYPNTIGAVFPKENLNSERYRGVEMGISYGDRHGDFSYNVSANVTYSRKQILHVERQEYSSSMERWKDVWAPDRYIGHDWGFEQLGQYSHISQFEKAPLIDRWQMYGNSKGLPGTAIIKDANGDGKIDENDMLPIFWKGQKDGFATNPPLQYGMSILASWKNLEFSMTLQGAALYSIYTSSWDVWGYANGNPTIWETYLDRWHTANAQADPTDPNTKWIPGKWSALRVDPKGTTDELLTNKWILNAAYLRIKSMEIGYNLPKKWLKTVKIENVRIFVNGFNLYTFCSKDLKHLDPEKEEGDYQANLTYPLMKSYNFGISINF